MPSPPSTASTRHRSASARSNAKGSTTALLHHGTDAMRRDVVQDLFDLMGADALRSYFDETAPRRGSVEHLMRFSLGTTIYAGTTEIQRTMIAQWGLGLPR